MKCPPEQPKPGRDADGIQCAPIERSRERAQRRVFPKAFWKYTIEPDDAIAHLTARAGRGPFLNRGDIGDHRIDLRLDVGPSCQLLFGIRRTLNFASQPR